MTVTFSTMLSPDANRPSRQRPVLLSGPVATRPDPADANDGLLWFDPDEGILSYSDGAAWQTLAVGGDDVGWYQSAADTIATDGNVDIVSTADGGYDLPGTPHTGEFASTRRITLHSWQNGIGGATADGGGTFGSEVLRFALHRERAKAATAWVVPVDGYDDDENAITASGWRTVAYVHAHHGANAEGTYHSHWQVETPKVDGTITNRLAVTFGDGAGSIGVDVATVQVSDSHFQVSTDVGGVYVNKTTGRMGIGVSGTDMTGKLHVIRETTGAGISVTSTNTTNAQALFSGTAADAATRIVSGTVTGDTTTRIVFTAGAVIEFGPGNAARDTNLYRSAANVLKTDDSLHVTLDFRHLGSNLGFYNAAAIAKPTVTGAHGSNAALVSLLTALANLGLITNSSS